MIELIIGLAVLIIAIAVVVGAALSAHWGRNREVGVMQYISYLLLLNYGLSIFLSGRDLAFPDDVLAIVVNKSAIVSWLGRLSSVFLIFSCGERILRYVLNAGSEHKRMPGMLLFAFWIFYASNTLAPALFGLYPYFSHEFLYALLACQAALMANTKADVDAMTVVLRNALLALLVASAACIVWKHGLVMSTNYHGLVPGLKLRYAGLTSHANSLGPLCVLFMLCLWYRPFKNAWLMRCSWILGGISLVLT